MTKYKEYFNKMVSENKEVFDNFTRIHFDYSIDKDKNQEEFNSEGEKVLKIIHEWEDRLCKQSEKAGFGSYTTGLAEKFQSEVKSHFPLIDHIGIVVNKFSLKKIKLV
jgi:type I restriction-modification system DNA methylase subunit